MRDVRAKAFLTAIVVLGVGVASVAIGGNLDPPPGAVAPTMKPLDVVEPRVPLTAETTPGDDTGSLAATFAISEPGSYYLTETLIGETGKHGILILDNVEGVTIDLMGFDLVGSPTARAGIDARSGVVDVHVFNGSVRAWPQGGVTLNSAQGVRLRDIRAHNNTSIGISAGAGAVVTDCMSADNTSAGIAVGSRGVISRSVARSNNGDGMTAGNGSTITHCSSLDNGQSGFAIGFAVSVNECSTDANDWYGVITFGFGCSITNSSVRSNGIDGIRITNDSVVRGNNCMSNGAGTSGAGIRATGPDNRIEGNHCYGNRFGIQVGVGGNLIAGNTCAQNSVNNWSVAAGNVCVVSVANTSGSIFGNSGGVAPGSSSRWINYTY